MAEARFIEPTKGELRLIEAAEDAARELKAMGADQEAAEQRDKVAALKLMIAEGLGAKKAVAARRQARRKHGLATKNRGRMAAMLDCAAPFLRRSPDDFNRDPLLVVTNTHTLRFVSTVPDPAFPDRLKWTVEAIPAHRREDLITALVPVDFDDKATCPKWRANLERFQPDAAQRRTIQAFTGAGLLGKLIQRLMFHYGTGGNFKSVFLEVVTRVLGDSFAIGLPTESLIGDATASAGGARPDLERVFGKRMLRVLELPAGVKLKADLIKKLTGGEKWPVRTLYKSFFEFAPNAKPHMSGNDFPEFDGSDGGMRRRLLVAEWPVKIEEKEQRDFDVVVGEFMAEAPGILNWLIEGAIDYLQNGLVVAEQMRALTDDYFDEMDPLARFVRDCVEAAPGNKERARDVYNAYVAHCQANARRPIFETRFGRAMSKRFKRDDGGRVRMYCEIRLHDVPEMKTAAPAPDEGAYGADSRGVDDYAPL
jgi:putative DNA primase/helicase